MLRKSISALLLLSMVFGFAATAAGVMDGLRHVDWPLHKRRAFHLCQGFEMSQIRQRTYHSRRRRRLVLRQIRRGIWLRFKKVRLFQEPRFLRKQFRLQLKLQLEL